MPINKQEEKGGAEMGAPGSSRKCKSVKEGDAARCTRAKILRKRSWRTLRRLLPFVSG